MKNMRYATVRILIFIGLAAITGRAGYRFICNDESFIMKKVKKFKAERDKNQQHPIDISYDFNQLVTLIETSSRIKWESSPQFEEAEQKNYLDRIITQNLLDELLQERVKLRNYILDLKGCSSTGIPIKRYRSLLYYMEILENNITDIQSLMKKEELFK